ncbi:MULTISPECIES: LysR family transcriptional regulator [Kocuria]|uniref:LysR family transcriptional regulator n=1 Tax=Kocuria TaxID=57493 RepID=UPI0025573787|nr:MULTISPECIES: LysR family transcriptional regulator [Kocuria]
MAADQHDDRDDAATPPAASESMDPGFTLRQLDLFVAAAEHGGFAPAAQARHLSPNSVAQAVTDLERRMQTRLVLRHRARGITLTASGRQLAEAARDLLRRAGELPRGLSGDALSGPVSVGCYTTLAPTAVPELWTALAQRHPELELSVREGSGTELAQLVRDGSLDMLVAYELALPADLPRRQLFLAQPMVALAGSHRLADRKRIEASELAEEPLVLFDQPPSGQSTLTQLRRLGLSPRIAHRTADFELMRSLVARGIGFSIQYLPAPVPLSREGLPIVTVPLARDAVVEPVVLAWSPDAEPTARAAATMALIRERLGQQERIT